jgi:hypothetical protein
MAFVLAALGAIAITVVALALPSLTEDDLEDLKGVFGQRITVENDPGHHRDFVLLDGEKIGVIEFEENDSDDDGLGPGQPAGNVSVQGSAQVLGPIDISGPAPFVDVFGTVFDDGTFVATGQGTVAEFPNVRADMEGTIALGSSGIVSATYTLGADGKLPGGQAISYTFQSRQLVSGDVNCDGVVDGRDVIQVALHLLGQSVTQTDPCPDFGVNLSSLWVDVLPAVWADPNCSGAITPDDMGTILSHTAGLAVDLPADCIPVGTAFQPVP